MESLSKGILRIGNVDVFFEGFTSANCMKKEREGWKCDDIVDIEGWPAIIFRSYYQKSVSEVLEDHDKLIELLHVNKESYESLEQLSKKYLGIEIGSWRSPCIYIIA